MSNTSNQVKWVKKEMSILPYTMRVLLFGFINFFVRVINA